MSNYKNVLVVYKKSSLELAQENNNQTILKLLEANDPSVANYQKAHDINKRTIEKLKDAMPSGGHYFKKVQFTHRADIETFKKEKFDLVISVGGDGTFLWASKFVGWQTPILGINSDSERSVGFYTLTDIDGIDRLVHDLRETWWTGTAYVERLQIAVNGKKVQGRILNDILFAASHPAAMTKYSLTAPNQNGEYVTEEQKSSGIWISTAGGSTGANLSAGGWILPIEDKRAQYVVREPMKNLVWGSEHKMIHGFFSSRFYDKNHLPHPENVQQKLVIVCQTREAILACDGDTITIPVTIGDRIEITGDEYLQVLGKKDT